MITDDMYRQQEKSQELQEPQEEAKISREQLSLGRRLLNWRTIVPLVIVVAALIFFAQKANINPQKTWAAVKSANMLFFLAAFVTYYFSFVIRGLRWGILLENVGYTKENGVQLPKFWKLVEIIYISFFANSVVPAKLGELYRAYLLQQETGVSGTRGFGTVIAERLLDLIMLLLMFIPAIIISLHEQLPSQLRLGLEVALAAVILGIIALFILRQAREPIAKFVPQRFRVQYYHLHEGMLGSFRRVPTLTGLTIGVWLCEALRFYFIALSLNLITGDPVHVLTASVFIGLGEALLTVVPATGGGIGVVEGGMVAMIALFNHGANSPNLTAAAILLDRTISYFSLLVIGFIVFLIAFGRQTAKKTKSVEQIKLSQEILTRS